MKTKAKDIPRSRLRILVAAVIVAISAFLLVAVSLESADRSAKEAAAAREEVAKAVCLMFGCPGGGAFSFSQEEKNAEGNTVAFSATLESGEVEFHEKTYLETPADRGDTILTSAKLMLDSIFVPAPSPYPDAITSRIICPPEMLPQRFEDPGGQGFAYVMYAGERRNYGVCSMDLVKYKAVHMEWYCPGSGILREVRAFSTAARNATGVGEALSGLIKATCLTT